MSRTTTKQFQAHLASAVSPGDIMLDDILYKRGIPSGSLAWLPDTTATGVGAVRADTWRRNEAERDRFRRRNCTPAPGNPARSSRTKRAGPGPTGTRARRARRAWRPAPARARPPTAAPTRPYLRAQFEEMTKMAISILSMGSGVCTLDVDHQQ